MAGESEKHYRAAMAERMARLRNGKDMSYTDMAAALQIGRDAYIKAEERGALKPYLIEVFAHVVDEDPYYVLTGKRRRAAQPKKAKPGKPAKSA